METEILSLDEFLNGDAVEEEEDPDLQAAIDLVFVGFPSMGHIIDSHLKETYNVYRTICIKQSDTYYLDHWGYQPKNIPPKHATCSSRRRGRPCKKRR